MNVWLWSLGSMAAGTAVGLGITWWEFAGRPADPLPSSNEGPAAVAADDASRGRPRVVVEGGERFDFGAMQRGEKRRHTFVFRNAGTAPLSLVPGNPSCSCTVANLSRNVVPPGETAELELEWTPNNYAESFSQGVEVRTNDLQRSVVPLNVFGRVVQSVRPVPDELFVGRVPTSAPAEFTLLLLGYREPGLQSPQVEFAKTETAASYQVMAEPLSDEERLLADPLATSGLKLRVTLNPGLPLGPIQQTIRLTTNWPDTAPVEIAVRGTAVSDVSVVAGRNFDPEHNVLTLGPVPQAQGATVTLHVAVKGPNPADVQVRVVETFPADVLRAELGAPKPLGMGATVLHPLTIAIPAGSRVVNHLGTQQSKLGRVEIATTHPGAERMLLYVQFAVE